MHDHDRVGWQLCLRIEPLDRWIVPGLDFAEEDLGKRRPIEDERARRHALEIDHRHHAAHHGGELHESILGELVGLQRHVGGTEGNGPRLDLLDAAAGPDRLVVQAVAGRFPVGVGPFRIDRVGKRGAGAGNIGSAGGCDRCRRKHGGREQDVEGLHGLSPLLRPNSRATRRLIRAPEVRAVCCIEQFVFDAGFGWRMTRPHRPFRSRGISNPRMPWFYDGQTTV